MPTCDALSLPLLHSMAASSCTDPFPPANTMPVSYTKRSIAINHKIFYISIGYSHKGNRAWIMPPSPYLLDLPNMSLIHIWNSCGHPCAYKLFMEKRSAITSFGLKSFVSKKYSMQMPRNETTMEEDCPTRYQLETTKKDGFSSCPSYWTSLDGASDLLHPHQHIIKSDNWRAPPPSNPPSRAPLFSLLTSSLINTNRPPTHSPAWATNPLSEL